MTTTPGSARAAGGNAQRQHILDTALALMAQHGVDGTSMRDLATATGLNVATLYHYFSSKRDLLVSVLEERGFIEGLSAATPAAFRQDPAAGLAVLLADMLRSMLEVEDFIRLMLGEVLRGDETAKAVGNELFAATFDSLERWVTQADPALAGQAGPAAAARLLRALIVGLFFEHVAGEIDGDDAVRGFANRAAEAAAVLNGVTSRARADGASRTARPAPGAYPD